MFRVFVPTYFFSSANCIKLRSPGNNTVLYNSAFSILQTDESLIITSAKISATTASLISSNDEHV